MLTESPRCLAESRANYWRSLSRRSGAAAKADLNPAGFAGQQFIELTDTRRIAVPLHLGPAGPMLDRGFEIGRRSVHTRPRYFDFKPVETLFRETTLARPTTDEPVVTRLREAVASSAAAVTPGERGAMVAPWLATLDWQHRWIR